MRLSTKYRALIIFSGLGPLLLILFFLGYLVVGDYGMQWLQHGVLSPSAIYSGAARWKTLLIFVAMYVVTVVYMGIVGMAYLYICKKSKDSAPTITWITKLKLSFFTAIAVSLVKALFNPLETWILIRYMGAASLILWVIFVLFPIAICIFFFHRWIHQGDHSN
jgi:hypothetical protein